MNVRVNKFDIGVAFVVSIDYSGHPYAQLSFTHNDSDSLARLFKKEFAYEVYHRINVSRDAFLSSCKSLAAYKYPPTCTRIFVYFSGHGTEGKLIFPDNQDVSIDYVINLFKPSTAQNATLANMVRMFFIDACRGAGKESGVLVTKGGSTSGRITVSDEANIFVAYASPLSYMAYGVATGSCWTTCLVEAFQNSKVEHSVYDILTEAHRLMAEKNKTTELQTPELMSRLKSTVYFKKEAQEMKRKMSAEMNEPSLPSNNPSVGIIPVVSPAKIPVAAPVVPPSLRSQKAIITPISRLQEYCQQNKLRDPDYRELPMQSDSGFRFTVIVNGRSYTGPVKPKKQEAKHSAAELAVHQLQFGLGARGSSAAGSTLYKQELKEKYFDKNQIQFKKEYYATQAVVKGFQCTLTIPGKFTVSGQIAPSKSAAENEAAKAALKFLKLL